MRSRRNLETFCQILLNPWRLLAVNRSQDAANRLFAITPLNRRPLPIHSGWRSAEEKEAQTAGLGKQPTVYLFLSGLDRFTGTRQCDDVVPSCCRNTGRTTPLGIEAGPPASVPSASSFRFASDRQERPEARPCLSPEADDLPPSLVDPVRRRHRVEVPVISLLSLIIESLLPLVLPLLPSGQSENCSLKLSRIRQKAGVAGGVGQHHAQRSR